MSLPRNSPLRTRKLALPLIGLLLALGGLGIIAFNPFEASPTSEPTHTPDAISTATPAAEMIPLPTPTAIETPAVERFMTDLSRAAVSDDEINDPDNQLVVINKQRPFRQRTYVPKLVRVLNSDHELRPEARDAMEKMFTAAADDGVQLRVLSAYRSYTRQHGSRQNNGRKHSGAALDAISARPGFSEHQTGLVADLGVQSGECDLNRCFADTAGGRWIQEHAGEYGFIVRYPDGENDITGYVYEPWHVRFIGVVQAADMSDSGAPTLEQYFGLPAAPDY